MFDEVVYNYEQPIKFIIGIAGTGKSTKLAGIANKKSIVLTPTHKAKEVLQAKGVENVYTIHSVLKLVPTLDMNFRKKGKMQRLRRIGDVDLKAISLVIIDEYSMIPAHILDLLMELLPAKASVSIYGDSYQLPPVDGDPIDPYWYTENITTLSTQYRAEAPEVIETFTRFVHYLQYPSPQADLTINKKIKKGSLDSFNPATDRALAYTNDETVAINNRIAKVLDLPKDISIGETIAINGLIGKLVKPRGEVLTIYPSCIAKGVLMSGDKLQNKINEVEYNINKFNQQIVNGLPFYVEIEDTIEEMVGPAREKRAQHHRLSSGGNIQRQRIAPLLLFLSDLPHLLHHVRDAVPLDLLE